jgi:hypothetical protein
VKTAHPWDADEAEFNKIMAEYDGLNLRLVNTPTGRVLALEQADSVSEQTLRDDGVPEASLPTARKLLSFRFKIREQKSVAELNIRQLREFANDGHQGPPEYVQSLKFRNGALRGLINDLKKITDELDPPPTVDDEFKKVMAEYDALVLRLAKTQIGRVLAMFPPGKGMGFNDLSQSFPKPDDGAQAYKLLEKRGQILAQADVAEKALASRARDLQDLKKHPEWPKELQTTQEESIRKYEHEAKVAMAALRTFVDDLKKLADGIDPPKGK